MIKKLAIFGASGFVGFHLFEKAKTNHFEIHGFSNKSNIFQQIDICDKTQVENILYKVKPDVVVNTAAISDIDFAENHKNQTWQINVVGAENIANACSQLGCKHIYFSSDAVFSGKDLTYSEKDLPEPVNYYGYTKMMAEKTVASSCPSSIIVRISLVLGFPLGAGNTFFTKLTEKLESGVPQEFPLDEFRTPIDVFTLSDCILELSEKTFTGIIHLASIDSKSRFEIARLFALHKGYDKNLVKPIASSLNGTKTPRHKNGNLNIEKAGNLLNTKLLTVEESITKSIRNNHLNGK